MERIRLTSHHSETPIKPPDRMWQAIAYAAGRAAERHGIPGEVLADALVAAHDHKGVLSCLWRSAALAETFGPHLAAGWEWVGETKCSTEHFVGYGDDDFLYSGDDRDGPHSGAGTARSNPFERPSAYELRRFV